MRETEIEAVARDAIAKMQGAADDVEHGDTDGLPEYLRDEAGDLLDRLEAADTDEGLGGGVNE